MIKRQQGPDTLNRVWLGRMVPFSRLQVANLRTIIAALVLALVSLSVSAEPQTVTLELPTMNCAVCPITVKKALTKLDGVTAAEVSYEKKQAVVTFDDQRINTEALIKATTNAGYPSSVRK